jgi:hypothetical protein
MFGFISALLSFLFNAISTIEEVLNAVGQVFEGAWQAIANFSSIIWGIAKQLINTAVQILEAIGKSLEHIIIDLLHGQILKVIQDIQQLFHQLGQILGPLITVLKRLQQIQRSLQMQYLKQFVDLIQRLRKIVAVFRLLHLNFANKLDLYLATLESDVGAKWAKLIAHINAVNSVLDQMIDPSKLLRPGGLLGSVGMMMSAVSGLIKGISLQNLLCLPALSTAGPVTQPWPVTQGVTISNMQSNSGDYRTYHDARDAALRQYAIDLGVRSLV